MINGWRVILKSSDILGELNYNKKMGIVSPFIQGRLGNMMFQIATSYVYGLKYDKELILNLHHTHEFKKNGGDRYLDTIFKKIKIIDSSEQKYDETYRGNPNVFRQDVIPERKVDNLLINGFYFAIQLTEHVKQIQELFEFPDDIIENVNSKYRDIINLDNTCSIHVRRGDYLDAKMFYNLDLEYYKRAISNFNENTNFIIFSDDINWCKENIKFIKNCTFIENNEDLEDLYLMSRCDDHIIANSSFSFWGAFLNKNLNKKVYFPEYFFTNELNHSEEIRKGILKWAKINENWISLK